MKNYNFSIFLKIILPLLLIAVLLPLILLNWPISKTGEESSEAAEDSPSAFPRTDTSSASVITEEDLDESAIAAVQARAFCPDPSDFWSCVPAYYTYFLGGEEKYQQDESYWNNPLGLPCIELDSKEIDRVGRLLYADYSGYPELNDYQDDPEALYYAFKNHGIYYATVSMGLEDSYGDIFAVNYNADGSADVELHYSDYVPKNAADSTSYRIHLIKEYSEADGKYIVRVQDVTLLD